MWSLGQCKRNPALFDPAVAAGLTDQAAGHIVSSPAVAEELRARDRRRRDEGLDYTSGEGHTFSRDDGRAIPVERGATLSASGFYEQQGRIDGAICDHTEEQKMAWLRSLHEAGVRNIEMEVGRSPQPTAAPSSSSKHWGPAQGTKLAGFCHATGIPACMVCTVVVDRLQGDQVVLKPEQVLTSRPRHATLPGRKPESPPATLATDRRHCQQRATTGPAVRQGPAPDKQ